MDRFLSPKVESVHPSTLGEIMKYDETHYLSVFKEISALVVQKHLSDVAYEMIWKALEESRLSEFGSNHADR